MERSKILSVLLHEGCIEEKDFYQEEETVLCPIHGDKRPSMRANLVKGAWLCHSCGEKGGDAIELVAKIYEINRVKAMVKLCEIQREVANGNFDVNVHVVEREKIDYEELRQRSEYFFYSLEKVNWGDVNNHYLLGRGFDRETLTRYDVRIDPTGEYPILIPLIDGGKFLGYISRCVNDSQPKYLFSRGFPKKGALIGEFKRGIILVVEGIMDLMMATQHGYQNTCTPLGCDMSNEQVERLNSIATRVILALDNDKAGQKGMERIVGMIDVPVARFWFPAGVKDIGEMSRQQFVRSMNGVKRFY